MQDWGTESAMNKHYLSVHCHYYQPPRGNPLSGEPLIEPAAAPYQNWNERITAECYEPNARLGNIKNISFNLGETLAAWLADNAPETYQSYIAADKYGAETRGVGNAISQPMHHTILPLARRDDIETQVKWGKQMFAHRFGRQTEGMWLPEMAVNLETLEVMAEQGIQWTILTDYQVVDKPPGAGPFWVDLPNNKRIKIFVRDGYISNDLSFGMGHLGGAGRWARHVLAPYRPKTGQLTLIASDGETFGHHWRGEEHFLHWLLAYEARAAGYKVCTLADYAHEFEPEATVDIYEDTAWSSGYGLARWATGSPDTAGDSSWKGALRRALDNLRYQVDGVYQEELQRVDEAIDPIELRDAYVRVIIGDVGEEEFLKLQEVDANGAESNRLLKLVQAQYYRQRMYASCAFFFDSLDDLSTRYGIASAAKAISLTNEAVGVNLEKDFRSDLRIAVGIDGESQAFNGADIYDEIMSGINS